VVTDVTSVSDREAIVDVLRRVAVLEVVPRGAGDENVGAAERVGDRSNGELRTSSSNTGCHSVEARVEQCVGGVRVGEEERDDTLGHLVNRPDVVGEVLHVLLALEAGATVLLAALREVL